MEPEFFYNDYDFDEDKNYLIYFRGNFGPPSKGHFSLVEKYCHFSNVKILISQIGGERHGVPYWLNRKIWKIYIKEMLPVKRIYLKKLYSSLDVLDYIENVDTVIFLKGNETEDKEEKERDLKERYSHLFHKLRRRNIKLDYLIIDRPLLNVLSTTKFIENILKRRYENLRFFVPDNLSDESFKYIIKKLKRERLK
jgi:hypothetical protein